MLAVAQPQVESAAAFILSLRELISTYHLARLRTNSEFYPCYGATSAGATDMPKMESLGFFGSREYRATSAFAVSVHS